MNIPQTIHATSVARVGRAILIIGRSGSGKSDLGLRLIDRGAGLISDDYTIVTPAGGRLIASAPERIRGVMEVRGVGLLRFEPADDAAVALIVDLDSVAERMPEAGATRRIAGVDVPLIALAGLEGSAPIKVELALDRIAPQP